MQSFWTIIFLLTVSQKFAAVTSCNITLLNTCISTMNNGKMINLPDGLVEAALAKPDDIFVIKPKLCPMKRDDFQILASCANDDMECSTFFFRGLNPYTMANAPEGNILDTTDLKEKVKIVYDMICDDTCVNLIKSYMTPDTSPEDDSVPEECAGDLKKFNDSFIPFIYAKLGVVPEKLTDEENEDICVPLRKMYDCIFMKEETFKCRAFAMRIDPEKTDYIPAVRDNAPDGPQSKDIHKRCQVTSAKIIEDLVKKLHAEETNSAGWLRGSFTPLLLAVITMLFY